MRSLVAGSLVALSVGMLVGACGDDTAGTGGGGTGGEATTTTSSGGGEGGGTGGCTNITVPSFDYLGSGLLGGAYFGGAPDPALGGAAEDLMVLEIWNPDLTGTVDLGSAANLDYANCEACALVYVDADAEGNPTQAFFQTGGTLTITSLAGGYYLNGSLSNVNLIEVTQDEQTGALTPVPGGACITINSQAIAIDPPVAGWECSPDYYEDGEYCDCVCGAVDPDCTNAALPIDGCYEGQTCSTDGTQCEGVPTDWTCGATTFGTGDGCNCLCGEGILDPDCEAAPTPAAGCDAGETCGSTGACLPTGWTCPDVFYEDGADCDCECGAVDPDCSIANAPIYGCEDGEVCNASGMCE